jgi:DNA-binding MarR family transcriptional regulator
MSDILFKREIILAMTRIKTSMKNILDPIFGEADLSFLHGIILLGISMGAITNISGICRETGMSPGNASNLCKRLEADGLLARTRDLDDERVVRITLSSEGMARTEKIWTLMDTPLQYIDAAEDSKKKSILTGLSDLSDLLENMYDQNKSNTILDDRKGNSHA